MNLLLTEIQNKTDFGKWITNAFAEWKILNNAVDKYENMDARDYVFDTSERLYEMKERIEKEIISEIGYNIKLPGVNGIYPGISDDVFYRWNDFDDDEVVAPNFWVFVDRVDNQLERILHDLEDKNGKETCKGSRRR